MRTSLNIPDEHLAKFDEIWQSQGISSRSRAVREAMSEYIESHQNLDTMEGRAAAVIVFDYVYERAIRDIHDIQHEFEHVVHAATHVHHGTWCLETIHCTGEVEDIQTLVNRLRNFDDIHRVKLMVIDGESPSRPSAHD